MNFDIKDVKSWANIHKLKVGDKGYFFNSISSFRALNIDQIQCGKIRYIDENWGRCFKPDFDNFNSYYFFLPLDAVKEDKPEKKYRSFEDAYELYKFLLPNTSLTRKDFSNKLLLNFPITHRKRDTRNFTTTELITSVEVAVIDSCHLTTINGKELEYWFANYEITNADGKWQPFGVEVNE